MNFTRNLVLALCFTFNPGAPGNSLYFMPSDHFMTREVFTSQTNWELVKSRNGIKVFSQWVTLDDGWKTRRLRGDFQVNMALPDLIAILKDGRKVKNWMEGVTESYTIKDQDQLWYSYAKFNIPWPFDDQDLIVENMLDLNGNGDTVYISLKSRPDMLPEVAGLKRMENFYGYWKLIRIAPGVSHVEYAAYSKSEPLVPRFIQDPIVQNTFISSLENLIAYCQSSK
jgi:hypothetical protein